MFEEGKYLLSKGENKGKKRMKALREGKIFGPWRQRKRRRIFREGKYLVCRAEQQQKMKRRKNLSEKENVLRAGRLPCGPKVV